MAEEHAFLDAVMASQPMQFVHTYLAQKVSRILFMGQDDIIGIAWLNDACLGRVYTSAGPPVGDQASDQP